MNSIKQLKTDLREKYSELKLKSENCASVTYSMYYHGQAVRCIEQLNEITELEKELTAKQCKICELEAENEAINRRISDITSASQTWGSNFFSEQAAHLETQKALIDFVSLAEAESFLEESSIVCCAFCEGTRGRHAPDCMAQNNLNKHRNTIANAKAAIAKTNTKQDS